MVAPLLTIIVGTCVSGMILQIYCDYDTRVKQGRVCMGIDPRPYRAVVDQDKANLDVARAQLGKDQAAPAYAQVNDQRNQRLARRNYVSRNVADAARSVDEQAKAQIAHPGMPPRGCRGGGRWWRGRGCDARSRRQLRRSRADRAKCRTSEATPRCPAEKPDRQNR